MEPELRVVDVTDARGTVVEPAWLDRAEPVHRQLRERLPTDYARRMTEVFANGARMCVAVAAESVRGIAVWRLVENTYEGRRLYVDDLVTDSACRSQGVGNTMLAHLEKRAHDMNCDVLALDSGTQRGGAHRFYFREGFTIPAFCFRKSLT